MANEDRPPETIWAWRRNDGSRLWDWIAANAASVATKYIRADTAPQLSQEQRQLLELVELFQRLPGDTIRLVGWGTEGLVVYYDGKRHTVTSCIAELRARLQPKPTKPTAEEWFNVATAPVTLDVKWERFKELRQRHLGAERHEVAEEEGEHE